MRRVRDLIGAIASNSIRPYKRFTERIKGTGLWRKKDNTEWKRRNSLESTMREFFEEGGYDQVITFDEYTILNVSCTCDWSTIYSNAWKDGTPLCKHIKKALRTMRYKYKNG